jgi:hypothetical protein
MICILNVFFKNNPNPDPNPDPKLRSKPYPDTDPDLKKYKKIRIHNTVSKTFSFLYNI